MKELSIEEKAKRYDEAIEKAKYYYAEGKTLEYAIDIVSDVFPELKESEDESIIRDIRVVLESSATRIFKENGQMPVWYDRAVAWLEKQGEKEINDNDISVLENWENAVKENKEKWQLSDWFVEATSLLVRKVEYMGQGIKNDSNKTMLNACINALRNVGHQHLANWLEKQGGQKPTAIQKGKSYKCIASPRYTSFRTGEVYKPEDNFLCGLMNFCSDCFEVVEKEQNLADKVELKFKDGDWVVDNTGKVSIIYDLQKAGYVGHYTDGTDFVCKYSNEHLLHLWTIQDAKDGDVLDANGAPFIYKKHDKDYVYFYCGVNLAGEFIEANGIDTWNNNYKVYPTTKEQRDLLFSKMKEAGYEWNAEKKELKKIEQKPAWSEEDMKMIGTLIAIFEVNYPDGFYKVNPIGTTNMQGIHSSEIIKWLKSLKDRYTWKPSDEQMDALKEACDEHWEPDGLDPLYTLYQDLKKLKG